MAEDVPINEGRMGNPAKIAEGFRLILKGLGIPTDDPHFDGTVFRTTRAWWFELCAGLTQPAPEITTFPSSHDQMIGLRDIPVRSMCAHHLLPFIGSAVVAYIPGKSEIMGLSKLSRIVEFEARRPQTQEELTEAIADRVADLVMDEGAGGVGVMIRANHLCMALRGVQHEGDMITTVVRGLIKDDHKARDEFLDLARDSK